VNSAVRIGHCLLLPALLIVPAAGLSAGPGAPQLRLDLGDSPGPTVLPPALVETPASAETAAIHVVFSAHSLPMKIVERGDPYADDVALTVRAVTQGLQVPWSLAFQSRNGRLPWLKPYLEDELKRLGREGVESVVVVPISFVSDHIETLFELDQLYSTVARQHGIKNYHRARCFNDDPRFPRVLQSIVMEASA